MKLLGRFFRRQNITNVQTCRVRIVMDQAATKYAYTWQLLETRERLTRDTRLQLDAQVAAYVRHLNEQPPSQLGTTTIEQWF
jgi:hypothetical protein